MLPSRGLRPARLASSAPRQSSILHSNAARKFSSVPRTSALPVASSRSSALRSTNWRSGAASYPPNVRLTPSSVRYGSWYAPWSWSWGRSSTPAPDANPAAPVEAVPEVPAAATEPAAAAAANPEVVAASSNAAPAAADSKLLEDILSMENVPAPDSVPLIDPTAPITHIGQLKELGLDYGWGTSAFFQWVIEHAYLYSDYGWGGAIILSTIALRAIMLVIQRKASDTMAKMAAMKPVLQPLQDELEVAKRNGDASKEEYLKHRQNAIYKDLGPAMITVPLVTLGQVAFGFGAFRCIRGMSTQPVTGMTTDGFAWFTDLTVPDPYYILPVASGAVAYALFKLGGDTGVANDAPTASARKGLMYGMPAFMTVITAFQPAGLQLYFVISSMLGAASGQLLRQPAVRKLVGIHPLPTKESNELFDKVARGELKLGDIQAPDGTIRYQAPTPTTLGAKKTSAPKGAIQNRGINIKAGTVVPAHLRQPEPAINKDMPDRDVDYEKGMPKGFNPLKQMDWLARNYQPKYVWRRMTSSTKTNLIEDDKKEKARKRAEDYAVERRRRFENRR
ncbi:hypothetical protein BS50DRAFT_628606 [Corynespora cassiicola Philippines]|uniref:Membrane insertase YidC/Oxa/ALB C-terminal domain-containing protein n=1 Tax=Corynespora cassiicola Philippines TaxID=1448308 RepID=A0A2T2PCQ2_CORCC|nr:hypothetical protein BS50DRAFT_628606 [Corynespora cassiicola Philippines]